MKIAIINNLFEPFARGGAETVAKIEREQLQRLGYDVIAISLRSRKSKDPGIKDNYYIPSIFPDLSQWPKGLRLLWHLYDLINPWPAFSIARILKENKVELVISHNLCGLGKPLLCLLARYRQLHVLHDVALLHPSGLVFYRQEEKLNTLYAKIYQAINRFFCRSIRFTISPSQWLLSEHLKRGFFKCANTRVVPNPILFLGQKEISSSKLANKKLVFLCVGLISEHKGTGILLDAWQELKPELRLRADLILAGSVENESISVRARSLPGVNFRGRLDRQEIMAQMQAADCLLVPSLCYENSPTVIHEAIALNLPFAASAIGGNLELIEKYGGIPFLPTRENLKETLAGIIEGRISLLKNEKQTKNVLNDQHVSQLQKIFSEF